MASGTELAKAYVQIMPSAKGIKANLTRELDNETNGVGAGIGSKIGGLIKGALATAGLGKALLSSLMEGGNLQQSLGGIETLFKENADKVKQYANESYRSTGLSANAYMEAVTGFSASLLQSLGGDTAKAAEISNMAMTDMADNSNKMGTSMELIQNAYQGFAKQNYTMLDNLKLGYGGTKTEMQRLLKDAQAITGVKYDINNLSDVYSAIHAIQGKLDITGTTAKEASTTLIGSFNSMKAAATDFLGKLALGEDVKPALNNLVETSKTFLTNNLLPMVGNIASGIGTYLINEGPKLLTSGMTLLENLSKGFVDGIPNFLSNVPGMITGFIDGIGKYGPLVITSGAKIIGNLTLGLIRSVPGLLANLPGIGKSILSAFGNLLKPFKDIGSNLIKGLWEGISNVKDWILDKIGGFTKGVLDSVKSFFGIHSPSRVFRDEVGLMIGYGLGQGITNSEASVLKQSKSLANNLLSTTQNTLGKGLSIDSRVNSVLENMPGMPNYDAYISSSNQNTSKLDILIELIKLILEKDPDIYIDDTKLTKVIDRKLGELL